MSDRLEKWKMFNSCACFPPPMKEQWLALESAKERRMTMALEQQLTLYCRMLGLCWVWEVLLCWGLLPWLSNGWVLDEGYQSSGLKDASHVCVCEKLETFEWIIHYNLCSPTISLQMYDRAISAPTSPTRLSQSGKRSWEEPSWLGSSSRLLSQDTKTNLSRSLQTLPTDSSSFEMGERPFQTLETLWTILELYTL